MATLTANKSSSPQVDPAGATSNSDARVRLLDVAEDLFAQHGFVATSTRMIASGANLNLGNLHYYFRSKEALYVEVFVRRGRPLVEQRMLLLEQARARHQDKVIPVGELIRSFVQPFLFAASEPGGEAFSQLHCRLMAEPADLAMLVRSKVYDDSTRAYVKAFRQALPQLPPKVLFWRLHFMIGAYTYTLMRTGRLEFISGGLCTSNDVKTALRQILPFLEAGFTSPQA
ncbi:TetR family transcriptional regulator [Variovorax paradoxus]|nr:TetR/AcrR family transcriptional regulator [Variovorax paradoxus]MBT2305103.1 TetR family transcriptional regulator [Variovorax paradoxus]